MQKLLKGFACLVLVTLCGLGYRLTSTQKAKLKSNKNDLVVADVYVRKRKNPHQYDVKAATLKKNMTENERLRDQTRNFSLTQTEPFSEQTAANVSSSDISTQQVKADKNEPDTKQDITTIEFMNHRPVTNRKGSLCDDLLEAADNGSVEGIQREKRVIWRRGGCKDVTIGNVLTRFYSAMLAAESAGASFSYQCARDSNTDDKHKGRNKSILAHLQDIHESPSEEVHSLINKTLVPPLTQICGGEEEAKANLDALTDLIRYDFRKMVQSAVPPVRKSEVAIHYRCGDALNSSNKKYGILPHSVYLKLISNEFESDGKVKSISIVTQPFDPAHLRERDQEYGPKCKMIVEDLVSLLKDTFPNSAVTVYNNPETETVARTLLRLASAQRVTICGASTFCVFPTIASPGMGYILDTPLLHFAQKNVNKTGGFQIYDCPKLNGSVARHMNDTALLAWVRDN